MKVSRGILCAAALLVVSGCGTDAASPNGVDGSPIPVEQLSGVRVEGPVTLLAGEGGRCWAVTYDQGDAELRAPLLAPEGYTDANISMADPMNPGRDYPGPALMDADGNPVGFASTGAMLAATYRDAEDPTIAEYAEVCGWDGPVLVADDPYGVYIDPDGLTGPARVCSSSSHEMLIGGETAFLLEECSQ